ncbi:MAG TPA: MFS transporter, partial [Aggregatilineales bacterium]|nr:MFS transporter [Aggregatilineales bacterium]
MTGQHPTIGKGWMPRFFTIWTGQAFSLLGSSLVQFALVWWLTQQTGSATVLATATLVAMLPQVILGPLAGTLVDRWKRRTVMIAADSAVAAATAVLLLLFATETVQVWHVYVIMLIRSGAGAFHFPAMSASTPLLVPEQHIARISGLNQMLQGLMAIVAPPVGALLISRLSIPLVLGIDIVTAGIAVVPLLFIAIPQPPRHAAAAEKTTVGQEFRAGLRYLVAWRGMFYLILIASGLNALLNPAFSLTPLLVQKHFQLGADSFALMESLVGVGMIVGGVFLGVWGGFKRKIITVLVRVIGIGSGTLLIGFAPANAFAMALLGMGVAGFSLPITNGTMFAIFQTAVRLDMQGRIQSLIGAIATGASLLSL